MGTAQGKHTQQSAVPTLLVAASRQQQQQQPTGLAHGAWLDRQVQHIVAGPPESGDSDDNDSMHPLASTLAAQETQLTDNQRVVAKLVRLCEEADAQLPVRRAALQDAQRALDERVHALYEAWTSPDEEISAAERTVLQQQVTADAGWQDLAREFRDVRQALERARAAAKRRHEMLDQVRAMDEAQLQHVVERVVLDTMQSNGLHDEEADVDRELDLETLKNRLHEQSTRRRQLVRQLHAVPDSDEEDAPRTAAADVAQQYADVPVPPLRRTRAALAPPAQPLPTPRAAQQHDYADGTAREYRAQPQSAPPEELARPARPARQAQPAQPQRKPRMRVVEF